MVDIDEQSFQDFSDRWNSLLNAHKTERFLKLLEGAIDPMHYKLLKNRVEKEGMPKMLICSEHDFQILSVAFGVHCKVTKHNAMVDGKFIFSWEDDYRDYLHKYLKPKIGDN